MLYMLFNVIFTMVLDSSMPDYNVVGASISLKSNYEQIRESREIFEPNNSDIIPYSNWDNYLLQLTGK